MLMSTGKSFGSSKPSIKSTRAGMSSNGSKLNRINNRLDKSLKVNDIKINTWLNTEPNTEPSQHAGKNVSFMHTRLLQTTKVVKEKDN